MKVTPEMKGIQTKPVIMKTYCNFKRGGLGEDTSD